MTEEPNGIHRRTMVKGMAWSVPVVAVAVTASQVAASQRVIGQLNESSADITKLTVNLSAIYVACVDNTFNGWAGQPYTATITITYTGSNPQFTFVDTENQSSGWTATVTETQITLKSTVTPNGCGQGASGFGAIAVSFNRLQADPGENSIVVQGSAVSEDGMFTVSPLVDQTPCSPTLGQSPIVGPRAITSPCAEQPAPGGN